MLKHETLKPDVIKGTPLCMDQFKVLFGSSRQPGSHDCDESFDDVHVYGDSSHGESLFVTKKDENTSPFISILHLEYASRVG